MMTWKPIARPPERPGDYLTALIFISYRPDGRVIHYGAREISHWDGAQWWRQDEFTHWRELAR